MVCAHCSEPILKGEPVHAGLGMHRDCFLRGILGSVAHQRKQCSCYVPGSTAGDPAGMTPRQAARAAVEEFDRTNRQVAERVSRN